MVIQIPEEQMKHIEALAHERGYDNATDYVLALIEADEEADDIIDDPEEDAIDLEANFREAWHQAMTGQTRPIEELWAELDREDEEA
jgi:Arc/MetJ-type ribon-helix-helix transcriptional regulator